MLIRIHLDMLSSLQMPLLHLHLDDVEQDLVPGCCWCPQTHFYETFFYDYVCAHVYTSDHTVHAFHTFHVHVFYEKRKNDYAALPFLKLSF